MTLEQLRAFVAVAERLNMTRAAEVLNLTQPAVSAAIAALEGRYRTQLFDRVGRNLELSEAGRTLLPEARAVLQQAEEARRALTDLSGLLRGELHLAASQTVATYWLPARVARFATAHPGLSMRLRAGNTEQVIAAILSREADLGFVEGAVEDDRLDYMVIGGDSLGLYVTPGHPLAGRTVTRAELKEATWVLREPGSGTRDHFAAGLAHYGLSLDDLDVRLEFPSNGAVLEAAGAGELVAVVSALAAASRLKSGALAPIHANWPARTFRVVHHRERGLSAAARAFRTEVTGRPG